MISYVKEDQIQRATMTVCFNTDSLYDLMTGDVRRGYDGKWYVNGGLGPTFGGIAGRSGCFKSTFMGSLMMRLAGIYDAQTFVFDSEDAFIRSLDRTIRIAGEHAGKLTPDHIVAMDAKVEYTLEDIHAVMKDIGKNKSEAGKKAIITTPFVDPKTGERIKVKAPTPVFIDSWTIAHGKLEEEFMDDKGADDQKWKTMAMADANLKSLMFTHMSRHALDFGFELMGSAHYDFKVNMDPYAPSPKQLQWAGQNETMKNVGSKFKFLTSPLTLVNSCVKLMDDSKQCKYKLDQTAKEDLSEILVQVLRCKNNLSGVNLPFVVSQTDGLLTDATDYNYLRQNKGFAFLGNNVTHQSVFLPNVNMTRNSFRGLCRSNPLLVRALQLSAQLLYVQNNWNAAGWPFPLTLDPVKLVDILNSDKNKYSVERVLNSRGYWLPEEMKSAKEYMSVFDVLEFFHNAGVTK